MGFLKKVGKFLGKAGKTTGKFVLRYGPLIAAGAVGLQGIPAIAQYAKWLTVGLGVFGVEPTNNEITEPITQVITQAVLLIGSIRKIISIIQKYQARLNPDAD